MIRVSVKQARQGLGEMLDRVWSSGQEYIIERHGQAIAALVPVEVALSRKRALDRIGAILVDRQRQVAARGNEIDEQELERLVDKEVHQVRRARRRRSGNKALSGVDDSSHA